MRLRLEGVDLVGRRRRRARRRRAARRRRRRRAATIPRRCEPERARSGRRAVSRAPNRSSRATRRRSSPKRKTGDARRDRRPRACRTAHALRQRAAREEADGEPPVRARSAAHQGRRLQRAHRAVRRDGARARPAGAHRRRHRLHPRRVLLPRVARGVSRGRRQRPRALAAGRSDVESVSCRHHAPAPHARRPRQAGGDPAADRPAEDDGRRRRDGAELDADPRRPRAGRSRPARDPDSAARAPPLRVSRGADR